MTNGLQRATHVIADIRMREGLRSNNWKSEYWVTCTCDFHAVAIGAEDLAAIYAVHVAEKRRV